MELYNTLKMLIELGKMDGLSNRIDIFYAIGKLTDDQYAELTMVLSK